MTNVEKRIDFWNRFSTLTKWAQEQGIIFLVTCFFRTAEEQAKLYAGGKSKCDGYNVKSAHQKYLAIDLAIAKDGILYWNFCDEYNALGAEWEELGGTWGGRWESLGDIYHFEYKESV